MQKVELEVQRHEEVFYIRAGPDELAQQAVVGFCRQEDGEGCRSELNVENTGDGQRYIISQP